MLCQNFVFLPVAKIFVNWNYNNHHGIATLFAACIGTRRWVGNLVLTVQSARICTCQNHSAAVDVPSLLLQVADQFNDTTPWTVSQHDDPLLHPLRTKCSSLLVNTWSVIGQSHASPWRLPTCRHGDSWRIDFLAYRPYRLLTEGTIELCIVRRQPSPEGHRLIKLRAILHQYSD
jgi:hypothetical protein